LFCTIHDAIPAFVRNLYEPWEVIALYFVLLAASLFRWTREAHGGIRIGVAALVAVVIGLAALPTRASSQSKGGRTAPNFVLIATDSLRADHLSCNGYGRETTPHLDALAARGVNFTQCLVPTASTHESWVSLLSSTEPRQNGLRHMFPSRALIEKIEGEQTFFPELLGRQGYDTAAIGGWCGTTFGIFDLGFSHVDVSNTQNHLALIAEAAFTNHLLAAAFLDNPLGRLVLPELERVSFTRGASAITQRGKSYLDRAAASGKPFFLTLIYHVTHLPYSASYPYYTLYTDPEYRGRNRYRIDFQIDEMIQRGFEHDLTEEERRHIIDLYDGCVRQFDGQVGAIVAHLKRLGLLENTVVGVWADHGDDLYEPGTTLGHGVTLFGGDQANHVPAVFAGPRIEPRRVDALVRSIDMTPTWLRWLDLNAPETWSGVDLSGDVPPLWALLETSYLLYRQPVPDLREGEEVRPFPRLDEATFLDPEFDYNIVLRDELEDMVVETKCFAVREGPWKLIRVPGVDGPIYRLFNLDEDPNCQKDLARGGHPAFERLASKLPEQG
ncbi:MAG: sulfatase, partial [Planctomycetota bacterium]|nr:sulfatase [Planctomycetota bacterium]